MTKYSRPSFFWLVLIAFFFAHIGFASAQEGEEVVMSDTRYAAVSVSNATTLDLVDKSGFSVSATVKNIFSEQRGYRVGVEFRGMDEENKADFFIWNQPEEFFLEGGLEKPLSFVVGNPVHLSGKYRLTLGMSDRQGNIVAMIPLGEREFSHTGRVKLENCTLSGDESGGGVIQITQPGILGTCEVNWDGATDELVRIMTRVTNSRYDIPQMVGQSDTLTNSDQLVTGNILVSDVVEPGVYQLEIVPIAAAGHTIGLPIKKTLIVAGKGGRLTGATRFESGKTFSPKESVTATALFNLYDAGKYELHLELLSQGQSCATPIRAAIEGQPNMYEGEFTVDTHCTQPEIRVTLFSEGKQIDQVANGSNEMPMKEKEKKGMIGQAPQWVLWGGAGVLAMLLLYVLTKRRARTNRVMMPMFFLLFASALFFGLGTKQVEAGSASFMLWYICNGSCPAATTIWFSPVDTDKDTYAPGETISVDVHIGSDDNPQGSCPVFRMGINGALGADRISSCYTAQDIRGDLYFNFSIAAPLAPGPFNLTVAAGMNGYTVPPAENIPLNVVVVAPAPTVNLSTFSPSTINAGQSATISLSTTGATSCSGDAGSLWTGNLGGTSFSNASTGAMNTPGTYTQRVTCTGPGGTASSATQTLTVNSVPPASGNFTSMPSCTIASGASGCNTTIGWTTSNTTSATLTNCGDVALEGTSAGSGNRSTPNVYVPYNSGCYRIHNGGATGPVLAQNTITVSCVSGTSWNGSSCQAAGVNGICGFAHGRTYDVNNSVIPVGDRCSSGTYDVSQWGSDGGAFYTPTNFDGNGIASNPVGAQAAYYLGRIWECDGSGGGLTRGCRLYYQPRCGSASGTTRATPPGNASAFEKTALCEIGTAGAVTTTASAYSWSCTNGSGPTANCSANRSGGVPGVTGQITASVMQYSLEERSWWQKVLAFITGRDHEVLATGAPASIMTTGTARIDWNTSSATSCQVSGPGMTTSNSTTGNRSLSGSTLGAGTHTYTLTCTGNNGSTLNDSAQVIVSSSGGTGGCCGTGGPGDDTPTGLTAVAGGCGSGSIGIVWNTVSGATSYELRDGGSVIYSGASANYTHSGLAAGSAHTYSVRANGGSGNSTYSGGVSQSAPASCAAVCGNGVTEGIEQCDTGGARGACPAACSNSCTTNTCMVVTDGVCGPAHMGSYATSPPVSSLCSSGTASVVNNNGNFWTWSCESMSGGATPACWANNTGGGTGGLCGNWVIDPGEQCDNGIVNGMCPSSCSNSCTNNNCAIFGAPPQCSSTHYNCTEGWPAGSSEGPTNWFWRCQKTGFADTVCMESKTASGSITTVNSCTIPIGDAMCNGSISWTTANASNPVLEVAGGSPAQVYGPVGNNQTIALGYGSHSVTLRDVNTGIIYDTDTMAASCAVGGAWSSTTLRCEPAPTVTLTVNGSSGPVSAAPGDTLSLDWTVSDATSCTASGKWSGSKSVTGGTESTTAAVPSGDYILACTNAGGMTTTRQVTVNLACTASTTPWSACGPPCAGGNGTRSRTITTGACIVTTQSESCTTSTCRDLNWKEVGQ